MPGTKKYLIYVIEPFGDEEKRKAERFRAKRNLAHYRNAMRFEFESCDGVVLGKGVAKQYPLIKEICEKEGIDVEDIDAAQSTDESPKIKPEPSVNIYEWTRQDCIDWLKSNEIAIPSDGYQSRVDLQTLVLESIGNG